MLLFYIYIYQSESKTKIFCDKKNIKKFIHCLIIKKITSIILIQYPSQSYFCTRDSSEEINNDFALLSKYCYVVDYVRPETRGAILYKTKGRTINPLKRPNKTIPRYILK